MEDQQVNPTEDQENPSFTFVDESEVAAAMAAQQEEPQVEQVEEGVEPAPQEEQSQNIETSTEDTQSEYIEQQDYSQEQVEGAVLEYLSERLGTQIESLDAFLESPQQESVLDERIEAIANFVQETGRSPQDWFIYQQLNPSEMDDMTAIQVQMASDYPNLSQDEVSTLMNSKYKLDPDLHTEDEVKLSQLQLKIDAQNARQAIEGLRDQYSAPEAQQSDDDSDPFDDSWYESMQYETEALDGVEFDLGNGKNFTFGLDNQYRQELVEKNTRLDEFFDPYVQQDGGWDYDKLNVHRAVIDNMEQIVQSVYRQGMADGQKGIVNQAANVQVQTPNQGGQPQEDSLAAQLRQALGGDSTWSF
tara:strand:- start:722 stop:1801 length:1080 start_codon:yes stop_codon:yes gene_type:complete